MLYALILPLRYDTVHCASSFPVHCNYWTMSGRNPDMLHTAQRALYLSLYISLLELQPITHTCTADHS